MVRQSGELDGQERRIGRLGYGGSARRSRVGGRRRAFRALRHGHRHRRREFERGVGFFGAGPGETTPGGGVIVTRRRRSSFCCFRTASSSACATARRNAKSWKMPGKSPPSCSARSASAEQTLFGDDASAAKSETPSTKFVGSVGSLSRSEAMATARSEEWNYLLISSQRRCGIAFLITFPVRLALFSQRGPLVPQRPAFRVCGRNEIIARRIGFSTVTAFSG